MHEIIAPYSLKRDLLLAVVQAEADVQDYASEHAFKAKLEQSFQAAEKLRQKDEDVLIAFPEDIGLGLALTQDFAAVSNSQTLAEAGKKIAIRHAYSIALISSRYGAPLVRALLLRMAPFIQGVYKQSFASLAKQYGMFVMSGSAPIGEKGKVFNEGYLFDPEGSLILTNRKKYLVPLELGDGLNLNSGDEHENVPVQTEVGTIGVTICFDAFHQEIVEPLCAQGVNVLIQPSFNPYLWTDEQEAEWKTGIWSACQRHKGMLGLNPMMVGQLLDIKGEGCSSICIHKELSEEKNGYVVKAESINKGELLTARLKSV